jgi:hypothetical protein
MQLFSGDKFIEIHFIDEQHGWAGTYNGDIYRFAL